MKSNNRHMDPLDHILHHRSQFHTYHLLEELYRSWGQYLCIQKYNQPRNDYLEVSFSTRLRDLLNLLSSIAAPAVLLRWRQLVLCLLSFLLFHLPSNIHQYTPCYSDRRSCCRGQDHKYRQSRILGCLLRRAPGLLNERTPGT